MTAVTYNIRLDQELRDEAFEVLDSYGLTPSQAIKLFLKQVAKTRTVPLTFDYQKDYQLSPQGENLLRQRNQEVENNEYDTFNKVDECKE